MKPTIVLLFCFFVASLKANPTQELAAVRARFNSDIANITNPLRDRYIQELHSLKDRAILQKNLELAIVIDAELVDLVDVPKTSAINSSQDFAKFLVGTMWSWGTSESNANSRIVFLKDGICLINNDRPSRWTAETDKSVSLSIGAKLKFSSNYQSYEGKVTTGGARIGKRINTLE